MILKYKEDFRMSKNKSNQSDNKIDILSQNADTNIPPVFDANDTRPYEQKNMPRGAFNKNRGSK